jgi:formylglycine-generating enzyme required for sulfatase activity
MLEDGRLQVEVASHVSSALRAARGGGWHSVPELARAACRFAAEPHRIYTAMGFRLVTRHP